MIRKFSFWQSERRECFDANAAFTITDDILNFYLQEFEEPVNEGEVIIEQ